MRVWSRGEMPSPHTQHQKSIKAQKQMILQSSKSKKKKDSLEHRRSIQNNSLYNFIIIDFLNTWVTV